jgi:peptidoglycan/LPS O-acetylase OafA/YrhL
LLRFAAAISVTGYHFGPLFGRVLDLAPSLIAPLRFGFLGVELFFMISGFVIGMSVQGRTWRSFLVHRVVRLYPTFWFALALSALSFVFVSGHPTTIHTFLANVTMLPGYLGAPFIDDVYWTLGVEWKFYAIMALLVALGLNRRFDLVGTVWSFLVLVVNAVPAIPGLGSMIMFPYGTHFAFGLLVMDLRQNGRSAIRLCGITMSLAGMLLATDKTYRGFIPSPAPMDRGLTALLMLFLALLFAGILMGKAARLNGTGYRRLGGTTYPIYLLHAGVGSALVERWRPANSTIASVLLALMVTLGLVMFSTLVIEERFVPALARSRFVKRLAGRAPLDQRISQSTVEARRY